MVKIAIFAAAAAALAGQATAQVGPECTPAQFYCGFSLLRGPNENLWRGRINKALQERGLPTDGTHQSDSLFFCSTPTTLALDEFCPGTPTIPGRRCQPSISNFCGNGVTLNDCCGGTA
ncbi:hypothetical protein GGTG_10640 [Gaeumannomyces tritici R3-111a-1]|uniref:Uncharacterized protein n=1 Tax=Gaeumannomyces tritici (strain R3-111a-1) TaxID=644352 RepID=J3PAW5_GAET3|nr:hypothetical protein GGTG_10640 [Gaeumannomyces tritici R3-111a-1]EJT71381.1 hypothetical protein GGTG_10640 [Gaeumannomyces tritici R3-111a-1]